jgi:hypothetical protein
MASVHAMAEQMKSDEGYTDEDPDPVVTKPSHDHSFNNDRSRDLNRAVQSALADNRVPRRGSG